MRAECSYDFGEGGGAEEGLGNFTLQSATLVKKSQ